MISFLSLDSSQTRASEFPVFAFRARHILGVLGLLLIALMSPQGVTSTFAQEAEAVSPEQAAESSRWSKAFDRHIAKELRQKPSLRPSFLKVVIEVANEKEDIEMSRTVGAVLHVIENDPRRRHRLMAVQALTSIGPEHTSAKRYREAMARLYALMQEEPSDRVRGVAAQSLVRST